MLPELKNATDYFEKCLFPQTRLRKSEINYRTKKRKTIKLLV